MRVKSSKDLKQYNRSVILNEIIKNQPVSRKDLTKIIDTSHVTISYIVKDLIEEGLVSEIHTLESTGGRPPTLLKIRGNSRFIISVVISDNFIDYSIFNLNLEIKLVDSLKIENLTGSKAIRLLADKIGGCLNDLQIDLADVLGLGISIPGVYEKEGGVLTDTNTVFWKDVNLKAEFHKRFNLPLYIENDANLAVYYEWVYGVGKEHSNLVYVFLSEGIGGGIIINDNLYKGVHGNAGEIGHIKVKEKGELCHCGGRGCLETTSSIKAIEDKINKEIEIGKKSRLTDLGIPPYNFQDIIIGYDKGDPLCINVIEEAINYLIKALSGIINFFDPGLVIIGDQYNFFEDTLIKKIKEELEKICYPKIVQKIKIVPKTKKDHLQLYATAIYVFDRWKEIV